MSADNFVGRSLIRSTWANPKLFLIPGVKVGFVIGRSKDKTTTSKIEAEFQAYQDIIQGDFMDSYQHIGLKTFIALKWISVFCDTSQYILKIDDNDVFFNIFYLLDQLNTLLTPESLGLSCCVLQNEPVFRSGRNGVLKTAFPQDGYPDFCCGPAYLMTLRTAKELYNIAISAPRDTYVWIEDVYFTGVLVNISEKAIVQNNLCSSFHMRSTNKQLAMEYLNCSQNIETIVVHTVSRLRHVPQLYRLLWSVLLQRLPRHLRNNVNKTILIQAKKSHPACSSEVTHLAKQWSK